MEMADLLGVEIARPGAWKLDSGPLDVTPDMLTDAAEYAASADGRPAPVKLGHSDPRFDGEPALGWLQNLRVVDRDGPVLIGDILGMPEWLASAAPAHWPDRSMEGWIDYKAGGRTYKMVVDGLALLGVTPPGMSTIRSLRDLPQALGVAASGRMVASLNDNTESEGDKLSLNAGSASADAPKEPPGAEGANNDGKDARMDPAKLREALGLAAGTSDDDVRAALESAGLSAQPPAAPASPAENPPAESPPAENPPAESPQDDGAVIAKNARELANLRAASDGSVVMIDATQLANFHEAMRRAERINAKLQERDRDGLLEDAIRAGKFPPSRRAHYAALFDADPEGTKQTLERLAPGLVPVTASGYSGGDAEDAMFDAEFGALFPKTGGSR